MWTKFSSFSFCLICNTRAESYHLQLTWPSQSSGTSLGFPIYLSCPLRCSQREFYKVSIHFTNENGEWFKFKQVMHISIVNILRHAPANAKCWWVSNHVELISGERPGSDIRKSAKKWKDRDVKSFPQFSTTVAFDDHLGLYSCMESNIQKPETRSPVLWVR